MKKIILSALVIVTSLTACQKEQVRRDLNLHVACNGNCQVKYSYEGRTDSISFSDYADIKIADQSGGMLNVSQYGVNTGSASQYINTGLVMQIALTNASGKILYSKTTGLNYPVSTLWFNGIVVN